MYTCVCSFITKVQPKKSGSKQKKLVFCLFIKKVCYICIVLIIKQKTK